jgi:ElaB/YqjD/DUF883 family membrane-anchored ribosome-binding protein
MNENETEGGAGPALAAHSKDGSTPGPTPASSATGQDAAPSSSTTETTSKLTGQARNAASRLGSSVSDAAGRAREGLSTQGSRMVDQGSTLVRERPLGALALTGLICFGIDYLVGRR